MNNLKHVWKCNNYNEWFILQKHQPHSSFQNLTTIRLSRCPSIKYLFPPLIMKLLSNLKKVALYSCNSMEEVVYSNRENEDEEMTTTTSFPHLDQLELYDMNNLKHIGGGVAANDTTNYVIHGQSKLDVVHWSLWQFSREIHILGCNSLMEVFETKDINNIISASSSNTTFGIPRPTNSIMHKLNNLKTLKICNCARLEYVFTFSTLESLEKLETLVISGCEAMKVIVREEYHEVQTLRASSKDMGLKSIELVYLPNLEGFFLGMNIDFQWPVLDHVKIACCPQMIAFTSGLSTSPKLKYIHSERGKHNIPESSLNVMPMLHQTPSSSSECMSSHHTISDEKHWSFHNLLECVLDREYKDTMIFPSNELQQLQKLERIHADCGRNVVEVFEVALEVINNESQTVVEFPKLREIALEYMESLKYIWKSNEWRRLEFPNLTRLFIHQCKKIEYVFTCSMVGCVMQLQELHITLCHKMKAVVKEEEEGDCDAKVGAIIEFPCLKSLELDELSSLEGFSLVKEDFTFPSLDTLTIKLCPKITVFTKGRSVVPQQTVVKTSFGKFPHVGEDINSFIMAKKQEGYII